MYFFSITTMIQSYLTNISNYLFSTLVITTFRSKSFLTSSAAGAPPWTAATTRTATRVRQNAAVQRPKRLPFIIFLTMSRLAQNMSERTPHSGQACVATLAVALSMHFPLSRKLHSCLATTSDSIHSPSPFRTLARRLFVFVSPLLPPCH